jgi:hypothetical protein
MHTIISRSLTISFAFAVAGSAAAAQQLPPVHPLGPVLGTSTEPLASVSQVRALPGGRVLVNDNTGRRVVMFDSTFKTVTVIADSTSATASAYGSRLGGLIAYRGDSTLFVDPASLSMLVIDANGKIVRTMAVPRPNDVQFLIGGPFGTPALDARGRLVYRASIPTLFTPAMMQSGKPPAQPDSALVVRFDLASRKLDTIAKVGIPKITLNMVRDDNGRVTVNPIVNPMPWTDDWAVLSDGTVAIVRGRDYRVELVDEDGKVTSPPKLEFDWQRMTDEDKTAVIDSTRQQLEKMRAAQMAQLGAGSKADSAAKPSARQLAQPDGGVRMNITIAGPGGGGGAMPTGFTLPEVQFVSLTEMPDYRPAFRQGASRGDADGNLWIRTSKVVNGGAVYDVIDNKGKLIDRVLVPPGRVIAGFGKGGVVYMGVVDGNITHLERARVR